MTIPDYLMAAPWWHWIFFVFFSAVIMASVTKLAKRLTIFRIDRRTENHTHQHTHQHIHNPPEK